MLDFKRLFWQCKGMEREAILQLKQSGATYGQIAQMIGRTRTRAMQLINGEGQDISGPCKDCGQVRQLHRHHESYWPEVVVLLCQPCHGRRHTGKIMRHKKVFDALPPNTSLTKVALAKKLGVHHDYAAFLGRMFGFQCTEPQSAPWENVNWDIPNKWLARIWARLPHVVASARTEQHAHKAVFDWREPMTGAFRFAIKAEIAKRKRWFSTGEITS